jgi:hypothetical protein
MAYVQAIMSVIRRHGPEPAPDEAVGIGIQQRDL